MTFKCFLQLKHVFAQQKTDLHTYLQKYPIFAISQSISPQNVSYNKWTVANSNPMKEMNGNWWTDPPDLSV